MAFGARSSSFVKMQWQRRAKRSNAALIPFQKTTRRSPTRPQTASPHCTPSLLQGGQQNFDNCVAQMPMYYFFYLNHQLQSLDAPKLENVRDLKLSSSKTINISYQKAPNLQIYVKIKTCADFCVAHAPPLTSSTTTMSRPRDCQHRRGRRRPPRLLVQCREGDVEVVSEQRAFQLRPLGALLEKFCGRI